VYCVKTIWRWNLIPKIIAWFITKNPGPALEAPPPASPSARGPSPNPSTAKPHYMTPTFARTGQLLPTRQVCLPQPSDRMMDHGPAKARDRRVGQNDRPISGPPPFLSIFIQPTKDLSSDSWATVKVAIQINGQVANYMGVTGKFVHFGGLVVFFYSELNLVRETKHYLVVSWGTNRILKRRFCENDWGENF